MATKRKRAPSRTRDEWAQLVETWKASGQSTAQFAAQHGLQAKALSTWRWRLRTQTKRRSDAATPKLVQLSVADLVGSGETAARWELTTASGHRLRVQAPLAVTELAQLLGTLVLGRGRR